MNIFVKKYKVWFGIAALFLIGCVLVVAIASSAPSKFPVDQKVTIAKNTTVSEAAAVLKNKGIIRSVFLFKVYVVLLHDGKGIQAGNYLFDAPQSSLKVAYRTAYGIHGLPTVKVTLPEGIASYDIARLLAKNIPGFDTKTFMSLAKPLEGKLFPDTYYFYADTTPEQAVEAMNSNFRAKTNGLTLPIFFSGKSFDDILSMASIVERESASTTDRRIIAGILWKRLNAGMPLQVDPPFFYIMGKSSSELTLSDLATSSPYNLYKYAGLPPTPISNPGLEAIMDTLHPVNTKYWYYLSDSNSVTHFSVTYDDHQTKEDKYIK